MLKEKMEKLYEEMDTMMETVVRNTTSMRTFEHMNAEDLELLQATMKLYNSAKELSIMQAGIIERQDRKLDEIMSIVRKLEMKSE